MGNTVKNKLSNKKHYSRLLGMLMLQGHGHINNKNLDKLLNRLPFKYRWFNMNYLHRKRITIDKTKVSGNGVLVNFPVLINVTDSDLTTAKADGSDILITDVHFKKLDFEIESFDNSTGALVAWVRVPQLKTNKDTDLYIYWESSIGTDKQNKNGVWDMHYKAVYHLGESVGGAAAFKDSTENNNHGTDSGSPTLAATGKIGKAISLDGVNDVVSLPNNSSLNISNELTLQAWYSSPELFGGIVERLNSSSVGYRLVIANGLFFLIGFDTGILQIQTSHTLSTFTHVVGTRDSSGTMRLYKDGIEVASGTKTGTIGDANVAGKIGLSTDQGLLQGTVDEVRISNIPRNGDWIKTEFNNHNNPGTFMSFEAMETL